MRENEASIRGRVVRDLIAHTTNDLLIGKKIKNGELRKQIGTAEPPWKCPECFTMQTIEMEHFTMELLESKENANREMCIRDSILLEPGDGRVIRIVDGERGGKIHEHDADFQNGAHFLVAEHTDVVLHDGDVYTRQQRRGSRRREDCAGLYIGGTPGAGRCCSAAGGSL